MNTIVNLQYCTCVCLDYFCKCLVKMNNSFWNSWNMWVLVMVTQYLILLNLMYAAALKHHLFLNKLFASLSILINMK